MSGRSLPFSIALLILLVVVLGSARLEPLYAQAVGATVTGTTVDSSGAAIAGAQISCKELATGIVRQTVSDTAGFYTLPNLAPGTYTVTATAAGFSTEIRSNFTLTVGQREELNITMQVGQVNQHVEVSGEAPSVETTSSEISAVVSPATIVDLPLNGRSWTDLTDAAARRIRDHNDLGRNGAWILQPWLWRPTVDQRRPSTTKQLSNRRRKHQRSI